MTKKILMVLTSHDKLGDTGEKTGFWLEEFAAPYFAFRDAGIDVELASPAGGQPPLDPKSNVPDFKTDDTHRFEADAEAKALLANTKKLADVREADYDAIFYPGGHGPMWDLVNDQTSIDLIEAFWAQNKPVSAVCHGPIVLANAKDPQGEYIVKGRKVTGFSNTEEEAVGLTKVMPQLLEDTLIARGGQYASLEDWTAHAQRDGNLMTGQNPNSSHAVAELVVEALK
ncbi:type 1 glutamine amidotransferase domain-containing protein [uncultured Tateyamaria sp.]|uniref:type 1 glutamine amidotransferase domain-containing protein n=1 Tax=uncultured Tateyamaria sp. TaxID=455651 RepID=UPI00261C42D8|nr:type 1 glutamine amidotransferase domain-containing protein [uncultured Tateyamaria sp.]